MGVRFTAGDIRKIFEALGMRKRKGSNIYIGRGPDGVLRRSALHSHGDGMPIKAGTAKAIAKQLGFNTVEEMYEFLQKL